MIGKIVQCTAPGVATSVDFEIKALAANEVLLEADDLIDGGRCLGPKGAAP